MNTEIFLDRLPGGEITPEYLRIAVMATLLEAAHSGGGIAAAEIERISSSMFAQFGLDGGEVGHLLEVTELLRGDAARRQKLLTDVGARFSLDQRKELLALVWRVIIVDGNIDFNEGRAAAEIRQSLKLTIEEAIIARQLAEKAETASALFQSISASSK